MFVRRVALLIAVTVLLQVTVFPHVRIAGRVPDLGLILAVAIAFEYGPEAGAIVGFVAGLSYDLFLATPLGLTALRTRSPRTRSACCRVACCDRRSGSPR